MQNVLEIDTREPIYSHFLQEAAEKCGVQYNPTVLTYGDYAIWNVIGERKAIGDLWTSYIQGTIHEQLTNMQEHCAKTNKIPLLVVHGSLKDYIKMRAEKTRSYIATQQFWYAISDLKVTFPLVTVYVLINCGIKELIDAIIGTAKYAKIRENHTPYKTNPRYKKVKDINERLLTIGLKIPINKTKLLLSKYGTLQNILKASDVEILSIKGIGTDVTRKLKLLRSNKA